MCSNFGTPKNENNFTFGTNGKFIILGVPILKHITVCICFLHESANLKCFPACDQQKQTITIHHECPCRIVKSHSRGWNFN